jgi:hypothetical protein
MDLEVLENLAPASQPTPPLVRYPGGVGLKIHAVFYCASPLLIRAHLRISVRICCSEELNACSTAHIFCLAC